jgi:uncharacterized integral membrane protein (TIGR00698 family)
MKLTDYLPGLSVAAMASLAAAWLSEHYGAPLILMGLLIGLAMNFVSADVRTHKGLDFAGRTLLRCGIVILGLQVTFAEVGAVGWPVFAALIGVMLAAITAALIAARVFGQAAAIGVLAGGATAICGASAALALYGVIGRDRVSQACFSVVLISITLASALAMTAYPILANLLGLGDTATGFLLGASIHDVAQSIGAGYAVSEAVGAQATIVKLTRVGLLAPVVALTALAFRPQTDDALAKPWWTHLALPWFILGFLGVVAANSVVTLPAETRDFALSVSKAFLVIAVTATAMRTTPGLILQLSWKTVMPVLAATLASLVAAAGLAYAFL